MAVIAIITSLVFLVLGHAYVALFSFIAGALAAAALFFTHKTLQERSVAAARKRELRLSEIDREIADIELSVAEAVRDSASLGRTILDLLTSLSSGSAKNEDIDALDAKTDEELSIFDRRALLCTEQEEWTARAESAKKTLETLETKSREAASSRSTLMEEWNEYLRRLGLPADIDPRTMDFVFGKIETIKGQLNEVRRLEERVTKMEETKVRYLVLAGNLDVLARDIDREPDKLLFDLDTVLRSIREAVAKRNERDKVLKLVEERTNRKKVAERTLADAQKAFEDAARRESEAWNDWRRWVSDRGFGAEISPPIALEALTKMGECVRTIQEREEIRSEVARLANSVGEYEQLASSFLLTVGQPVPEHDKLAGRIDALGKECEQAKINATKKVEVQRNLRITGLKTDSLEKRIVEQRTQVQQLLETGEAVDEEDFRVRARFFEEKQQLLSIIAQKEDSMRKISGEEDLLSLRQDLEGVTLDQLRTTDDEWRVRLEDLDKDLDSLRHEKAVSEQKIFALSSADDISRIRSGEEALLEEIRNLSREWGRNALAKTLLGKTRRHFEREQQPRVMNDAGNFFREISGGKYQRMLAPIGEDTVEIVTSREERKRPEQWSRGTAEQVYLSIRFGYIKNYTANGETLPVIMDDVLVNFDPGRAARTTGAILSLAETHQVLYFTCHPETVELFKRHQPSVALYQLRDGEVATLTE